MQQLNKIIMWKSIGSVNSPDNKSNRSREQNNIEPFAQASRLRLNQSQLSGDNSSPRFMEHYFSQKRSANTFSQKNLNQNKNPAVNSQYQMISEKQVKKQYHHKSKDAQNVKLDKSIALKDSVTLKPNQNQNRLETHGESSRKKKMEQSLKQIKKDQANLNKFVQKELSNFHKDFVSLEKLLAEKIVQIEQQNVQEKQKKNLNPQILSKLKQQNMKFNERIQEIQNKKMQIRQKYKLRMNES